MPGFNWLTADNCTLPWPQHVEVTKLYLFISEDEKESRGGRWCVRGLQWWAWGWPAVPSSLNPLRQIAHSAISCFYFKWQLCHSSSPTAGRFWLNTSDLWRALQSNKWNHQMGWSIFSNWSQVGPVAWVIEWVSLVVASLQALAMDKGESLWIPEGRGCLFPSCTIIAGRKA